MTDLVAHDLARSCSEPLLGFSTVIAFPGRVKANEGECTYSIDEACPSKAVGPARLRVEILNSDEEHSVVVLRSIRGQQAKNASFATCTVLLDATIELTRPIFNLFVKEIDGDSSCFLPWDQLTCLDYLYTFHTMEERFCI